MNTFLFAWYAYAAVMAALVTLSAGPRTVVGVLGMLAAGSGVLLTLSLVWPVPALLLLSAKWLIAVSAAAGIAFGRRADTRLIALLLGGAAALPLFLHYWQPPP